MTHIQALHLCSGAGCVAAGAVPLATALREALRKRGLEVRIVETGCLGPCAGGPVLLCEPEGKIEAKMQISDVGFCSLEVGDDRTGRCGRDRRAHGGAGRGHRPPDLAQAG